MQLFFIENWVDLAIVTVLLLSVLFGIKRGLLLSFSRILVLGSAVAATFYMAGAAHSILPTDWSDSPAKWGIIGISIFLITHTTFKLLARQLVKQWVTSHIRKQLKIHPRILHYLNPIGGGGIGLLHGVLLALLFALLVNAFGGWRSTSWLHSRILPSLGTVLAHTMPKQLYENDYKWKFELTHRPLLQKRRRHTWHLALGLAQSNPAQQEETEKETEQKLQEVSNAINTQNNVLDDAVKELGQHTIEPNETEKSTHNPKKTGGESLISLLILRKYVECEIAGKKTCTLSSPRTTVSAVEE